MSQGHGISLLSRAYYRSGDINYLRAARRALHLLDVPSHAGGVKAMWMDKYVWYVWILWWLWIIGFYII